MIHTVLYLLLKFGSKLPIQAISSSSCSFSTTISLGEILLNSFKKCHWNLSASKFHSDDIISEAVFDEIVEGVAIAVVGELVVGGREFLEALRSDAREISGEFGEFGENHCSSSHEAVDQRLLPHLSHTQNPKT
ncbi:hypothetical protein CsSME_00051915 [Camellia sinensis var. sinensis]